MSSDNHMSSDEMTMQLHGQPHNKATHMTMHGHDNGQALDSTRGLLQQQSHDHAQVLSLLQLQLVDCEVQPFSLSLMLAPSIGYFIRHATPLDCRAACHCRGECNCRGACRCRGVMGLAPV